MPVYINGNEILGTVTSSRRFKENIVSAITYNISKFRVVNFNYVDDPDNIQVVLIAEEVADICPELNCLSLYCLRSSARTYSLTHLIPLVPLPAICCCSHKLSVRLIITISSLLVHCTGMNCLTLPLF